METQQRDDVPLLSADPEKPRCSRRAVVAVTVLLVFCAVCIPIIVWRTHRSSSSSNGSDASKWEATLQQEIDVNRIRDTLAFYTNVSHIAGSFDDFLTANYTRNELLAAGIPQVDIEEYTVLLSYPVSRLVALTAPSQFNCSLKEDVFPQDPTSGKPSVDTFLSYSANGDKTAPLVYAHYGTVADFDYLASVNVNVSGHIVIARYGAVWRPILLLCDALIQL